MALVILKARGYPDPIRRRISEKILEKLELPMHAYFDECKRQAESKRLEQVFEASTRVQRLRFT